MAQHLVSEAWDRNEAEVSFPARPVCKPLHALPLPPSQHSQTSPAVPLSAPASRLSYLVPCLPSVADIVWLGQGISPCRFVQRLPRFWNAIHSHLLMIKSGSSSLSPQSSGPTSAQIPSCLNVSVLTHLSECLLNHWVRCYFFNPHSHLFSRSYFLSFHSFRPPEIWLLPLP